MSTLASELAPAERVRMILACLAADQRLGGVLFVGLRPGLLRPLADWLNTALTVGPVAGEIVTLGATQTDEDLWWQAGLPPADGDGGFLLRPGPGPLIDPPDGPARIVIVPDLGRASTAVLRAAVTLVGAGTAVADRHGLHAAWRPRSRWLAACSRPDLPRLSPHLLDRFAIRIDATALGAPEGDLRAVRRALGSLDYADSASLILPPPGARERRAHRASLPSMTSEAIELVVSGSGENTAPARRDLALARVARALAMLDASDVVSGAHVRMAMAVLGLGIAEPAQARRPVQAGSSPGVPDARDEAPAKEPDTVEYVTGDGRADAAEAAAEAVLPAAPDEAAMPLEPLGGGAQQEDDADSMPEYASLRDPWRPASRPTGPRGHIAGTEPTRNLAGLAIVATAFEAAKFQPFRHAHRSLPAGKLVIWGCDLRRYRRQPVPDAVVVLLLDHTCHRDWDWSAALAPYLRWAYVRRAALSVVELGHLGCADELRAEAYQAHSVLDKRVSASLRRAPGRATPLAHGLDLAIAELRRQLRQHGVVPEHSWLVVASDCRGNVPMRTSLRRQFDPIVSNEGVADALSAARAARSLPAVQRIVLPPPGLIHYAALPFELADALGGMVGETTS